MSAYGFTGNDGNEYSVEQDEDGYCIKIDGHCTCAALRLNGLMALETIGVLVEEVIRLGYKARETEESEAP